MAKYKVEVKVNSDITFEVNGYESEEAVIAKIEGDFDVFGRSTREFQMLNTNIGYVEILHIEEINN